MIHEIIDINIEGYDLEEPAKLYTYVMDGCCFTEYHRHRPCVIICPGGAYKMTSDREAEPVALQMNAAGINAFVLRYHCAPAKYPVALFELAKAVAYVRENADRYLIDKDRISIQGFSAGGHLACSLAAFWTESFIEKAIGIKKEYFKPNGCVLCYPVITAGEFAHRSSITNLTGDDEELAKLASLENQMNENVPPMFIWHTYTDGSVPVENSLFLINALRKNKISVEFHMYPEGSHGLSLANEETSGGEGKNLQPECTGWIKLATEWIRRLK